MQFLTFRKIAKRGYRDSDFCSAFCVVSLDSLPALFEAQFTGL